ncbi:minor tail protein [Gordonia phage Finkle]|uniref:Minor tail protein n=1 Tax=Gordonia phage Finkle TaxID=2926099 RepID=A0A9E7NJ01_9CAUD|nr:minor tail protein [Gordonia phage Finkle]UTN92942.1 minor tail protein [Gordonia phage Finkle]
MAGPVTENGTPWNQLPGATGGIRRNLTRPPANPMEQLQKVFLSPFAHFVAGLTHTDPEDWDTIEEIVDNLVDFILSGFGVGKAVEKGLQDLINAVIRALRGVPVVGGTLADIVTELTGLKNTAVSASNSAEVAQAQIVSVQQIFSVRSNRPLWEGLDPTGESTFPLAQLAQPTPHAHSYGEGSFPSTKQTGFSGISTHSVNGSRWVGGHIRIENPGEKAQITFKARRTTSSLVNQCNLYLAKLNDDGSYTSLGRSDNFGPNLLQAMTWMQTSIPLTLLDQGDVVLVAIGTIGSYSVEVAGVQMDSAQNGFGFLPRSIGAVIQPDRWQSEDAGGIALSAADGANIYDGATPYFQIGADVGQLSAPRNYFDNFNRASLGSTWIKWHGASGGADLSIKDNMLTNTSNQLLYQTAAGLYVTPLLTDRVAVEWDIVSEKTYDAGAIVCSSASLTNFLWIRVGNGRVAIWKADSLSKLSNGTSRASASVSSTVGRWRVTTDPATATFTVWKDNSLIVQWTDSTHIIPTGKGQRYAGALIEHSAFSSGSQIDNWNAFDIVEENAPEGVSL